MKHKFKRHWNKQGTLCCYCFVPMSLKQGLSNTATWDHKIPRSKGGNNLDSNLCLCCYRCNQEKADRNMQEFVSNRDKSNTYY